MNIASSEETSTSCSIHCTLPKRREAKVRNEGSIQSQTSRDDDDNDHDCDEKDDDGVDETSKSKQKTLKISSLT
jgi:hypothetical protein